jgi:hypothetical protein
MKIKVGSRLFFPLPQAVLRVIFEAGARLSPRNIHFDPFDEHGAVLHHALDSSVSRSYLWRSSYNSDTSTRSNSFQLL